MIFSLCIPGFAKLGSLHHTLLKGSGCVWIAYGYIFNINYSVWYIIGTQEVFLEIMKGFMVVKKVVELIRVMVMIKKRMVLVMMVVLVPVMMVVLVVVVVVVLVLVLVVAAMVKKTLVVEMMDSEDVAHCFKELKFF